MLLHIFRSGEGPGTQETQLVLSKLSTKTHQLLTLGDHNPTVYRPPGHYPWAGDLFSLLEYFLSPPAILGAVAEAFNGNGSTQKKHQYLLTSLPEMWPLNERNWNMRNEALKRDKDSRNAGTIQACFGGRRARGRVWGLIFFLITEVPFLTATLVSYATCCKRPSLCVN